MEVIYAGEEMPIKFSKSIFLAGPTPRNRAEVDSWRPDALKILEDKGYDGVVFVPELRKAKANHDYDTQVEWEEKYLNVADCIVFWVPRDISPDTKGYPKMAAFVTNVEWGVWCDSGKAVFGAPKDADKVGYLEYYAKKYNVPMGESLTETLENAIDLVGKGAERISGERYVPLMVWNLDSFQSWYEAQMNADNRLEDAKLLYTFRPGYKDFVFLWILKVNIYVSSEDRFKKSEFVLSRPDISTVLLWKKTLPLESSEVVLIKEFRSPAATEDGFIRELPSGSSSHDSNARETAAEEIHEETGFYIDPARLKKRESRQLMGTLSTHQSHLYSVELNDEELEWFKSQEGIAHGNEKETERTFIEVKTIRKILSSNLLDWSTVGMILSAYYHDWSETSEE